MKFFFASLTALVATVQSSMSGAATVDTCEKSGIGITALVTPVARNSRSFAQGAVMVYNIDTEEPAAASAGISITLPYAVNDDGLSGSQCIAITGFHSIDVMQAKASYTSQKGLLLVIPASENVDGTNSKPVVLKVLINQRTGKVSVIN